MGVGGVDDAVVSNASGGVVGVVLFFVLLFDWGFEGFFFFRALLLVLVLDAVALDGGQHICCLLAVHDIDVGVGLYLQKVGAVGAVAYVVVVCAKAAANDDGELGYCSCCYGRDYFCAVVGDVFVFVFAADHEVGDVLQED